MEERQEAGDLSRLLPDDVLADVLRHAAPRDLAVSRCVCRAWRALVDGRRLLRADLLPRSLAGLFIEYSWLPFPKFFARPSIDMADYRLPRSNFWDHCNGLLLYYHGVLNPATGGWTPFPDEAPDAAGIFLAFDPTVSSHYEVFAIPDFPLPRITRDAVKEEYPGSSEWPPSPYNLHIFSSRTGRWEERLFVRENEAAGTAAEIREDNRAFSLDPKAVCWRGALYAHCEIGFIMRISLSDDKYRVIKPPRDLNKSQYAELHIGKSEKGVYSALLEDYSALFEDADIRLRVWILDESGGQTNWILKHDRRGLAIQSQILDQQAYGHWILESDECNSKEAQEIEWNSDDDDENILHTQDGNAKYKSVGLQFLEFHPYREIVFLYRYQGGRGLAYHLNSSKVEDLGNVLAKMDADYSDQYGEIVGVFPYTPCLMGGVL